MDVVLVPGLWLDASSWHDVSTGLSAAGHVPHALSLRGLDSRTADRSGMMLADHVAEIVATIDACPGPVMLVGHAESCGLVHAAVNRRPARVVHVVHVGGLPSAHAAHVLSGFTVDARGATTHTAGFRAVDPTLSSLYDRMNANSAHLLDSVQRLTDDGRYDVPVTVVATEFTGADVRRWVRADIDPARELRRIRDVAIVDLPSGRWPQIERHQELTEILLAAARGHDGDARAAADAAGRSPARAVPTPAPSPTLPAPGA